MRCCCGELWADAGAGSFRSNVPPPPPSWDCCDLGKKEVMADCWWGWGRAEGSTVSPLLPDMGAM